MSLQTIRIIQANLMRSKYSHDMVAAVATDKSVDIIVVSEPNKKCVADIKWIKDKRTDVAVLLVNKKLEVGITRVEEGYVCIGLKQCQLFACYSSPNISFEEFKNYTDRIMQDHKDGGGESIIMGDLNIKSPMWGSPTTDARGRYWAEWLDMLNLVVLNTGEVPTFIRGSCESFIDVTCATQGIAKQIEKWQVMEEETLSDHSFIYFEIKGARGYKEKLIEKTKVVYDWEVFEILLNWKVTGMEEPKNVEQMTSILQEICAVSQVNKNREKKSRVPYWWNNEISDARRRCIEKRRIVTRSNKRNIRIEEREQVREEYKGCRKELRNLIQKTKRRLWQTLCDELNNDIWGTGYKIVTERLTNRMPIGLSTDKKKEIAMVLFPYREGRLDSKCCSFNVEAFTEEELKAVVKKMKVGKAPGTDGIPPEAIKCVEKVEPGWILNIMNRLIMKQDFPEKWKLAKVIFLPKGGKSPQDPSAYRPLCLLNTLSKLYEGLIRLRLEIEIEAGGGLSSRQYGFRKGKSTIQAIEAVIKTKEDAEDKWVVLVTLDVKNAFNTAMWNLVIGELKRRKVSEYLIQVLISYFEGRRILIDKEEVEITAGVPQGSILGPTLWNVLYDGVLELKLTEGATTIAFADDLALIVLAEDEEELVYRVNESLRRIDGWMQRNKLELAPQKTESVIMKGTRRKHNVCFKLRGVTIKVSKAIRYLGVMIGEYTSFDEHIKTVVRKAEEKIAKLVRVMPNIGGPKSTKRQIIYGAVNSILLYAAPVWCTALKKKKHVVAMERVQRKMLIRMSCAYRTVSNRALQVIAGILPMDLQVKERRLLYETKGENSSRGKAAIREEMLVEWQKRWDETTLVAQWTKRLIPNIGQWIMNKERQTDYYLTQVLSGHGRFQNYALRMGKSENSICRYCPDEDSVEHTIFHCIRWKEIRSDVNKKVGVILTPDNFIMIMTKNSMFWKEVHDFSKTILDTKEKEDRK